MLTYDSGLWETVFKPLFHKTCPPCGYLLPFVRSVRTSMVAPQERDALKHRLRALLLVESIAVESDAAVDVIAANMHRLPFLTSIFIDSCTIETDSYHSVKSILQLYPHPQQIRRLDIGGSGGGVGALLTQDVLDRFVNLEELDISCNDRITNVDFCSATLRRLYASYCQFLDDAGLAKATKLEVLDVSDCPRVTTVEPFAATLVELHAEGGCGITDASLKNAVNIRRLTANKQITTVAPFAASLVELDALSDSIDNEGLYGATSIVKLSVMWSITSVAPFAKTLRELDITAGLIDDEDLCEATGIVKFSTSNRNIVKPFANTLRELHCLNSALDDEGLRDATRIVRLRLGLCSKLTTLKPCAASLLELDVSESAVDDRVIKDATRLVKLNLALNRNVKTVAPFAATLRGLWLSERYSGISAEVAIREAPGIGHLIKGL